MPIEQLPPSREVRLQDGVLHGDVEQLAFDIYTGDAGTLANSMVKLELIVELKRSQAVKGFSDLLKQKLMLDGYIVVDDIDRAANDWHAAELVGPPAVAHALECDDED